MYRRGQTREMTRLGTMDDVFRKILVLPDDPYIHKACKKKQEFLMLKIKVFQRS